MTRLACALMLGCALAGCAGTDWSRNIYEGARQRNEAAASLPPAQPAANAPDYERYRREREALQGTTAPRQ
jgi:hypothetical protein